MNALIKNLLTLQTLEFDAAGKAANAKQIAELRAQIPAQIMAHYDRLAARGKKGVAVIRRQVCCACHMQVPRSVVLTLMNNKDIQICDSCGRYLYLEDTPADPATEAATTPEPVKARKPRKSSKPAKLQTV
jgi:predicted  nucleic acid-binding Zn-ribbon protein